MLFRSDFAVGRLPGVGGGNGDFGPDQADAPETKAMLKAEGYDDRYVFAPAK